MEEKLKKLFCLQQFEENERLKKLQAEAEMRYPEVLSEESLELVTAAGDVHNNLSEKCCIICGKQIPPHSKSDICPKCSKKQD